MSPEAKQRLIVSALWTLAMLFGVWGLWRVFAPPPDDMRAQLAQRDERLREQRVVIEELQQRVATLSRSDQISRDANRDLQGTLAQRDEQIASLRADVDFYERFVGATAQRHGLSVHELSLEPGAGLAWHFTATLTQNLNRGAINRGELRLTLEGTRNGRMQELQWTDLRQQPKAEGVEYSFRYFQQVEGDIVLPPGLQPVRVTVHLQAANGKAVEQSFTWESTTKASAPVIPVPRPDDA